MTSPARVAAQPRAARGRVRVAGRPAGPDEPGARNRRRRRRRAGTGAPLPEADALVTAAPGLALVVLVADCVPVLLADAAAGVVARRARRSARHGRRHRGRDARRDARAWARGRPRRRHASDRRSAAAATRCRRRCRTRSPRRAGGAVDDASRHARAGHPRRRGGPARSGRRSPRSRSTPGAPPSPSDLYSHRRDGVTGRFAGLACWHHSERHDRRDDGAAEIAAELGRGPAADRRRVRAAGRTPDEVTVVAVTKTFPASDVGHLAALGLRDVGENRDQEAAPKVAECCGGRDRRAAVALRRPAAEQQGAVGGRVRRRGALGRPGPAGRGAGPGGGGARAGGRPRWCRSTSTPSPAETPVVAAPGPRSSPRVAAAVDAAARRCASAG